MRSIANWDEFKAQVEFFVATAEQYHAHYLLFPELFTVQLFCTMPGLTPHQSIAALADLAGRYSEMFQKYARDSGLFIIGGSHPVRRDGTIFNVAHLFTPTGHVYTQDKLHVTPNEREEYNLQPGSGLHIFDTGHARIAILVCYDIEFPELARLLTLAGVEVIFVPFSTDERKAFLRVSYCGQARAVENMIYTALAGNIGNLPQVENFLINYGQAMICTPSDFQFPTDAIAARADTGNETVVISDLDLSALDQVREFGSVRLLRDRRTDLYDITSTEPIKIVQTL
jgi:predicted amidohydrolase